MDWFLGDHNEDNIATFFMTLDLDFTRRKKKTFAKETGEDADIDCRVVSSPQQVWKEKKYLHNLDIRPMTTVHLTIMNFHENDNNFLLLPFWLVVQFSKYYTHNVNDVSIPTCDVKFKVIFHFLKILAKISSQHSNIFYEF